MPPSGVTHVEAMTDSESAQTEPANADLSTLSADTKRRLDRLLLINESVKVLDPLLKEQAIGLLLESEFHPNLSRRSPAGVQGGPTVSDVSQDPDFGHLVEKWNPDSQAEWALLAAYYLTQVKGGPTVTGQAINGVLKDLGKRTANVTVAVSRLVHADPALMLQVRKDGTSRQARKVYRMTALGVSFVKKKLAEGGEAQP
jgi:hypothetical protein